MNIKRGLKRLWVVGTILWILFVNSMIHPPFSPDAEEVGYILGVPIGFWILLYMGFWVSLGFSSNKKKDETNE